MPTEYVIRGNSAILKCSVPSFVADFISVEAWVTSEGQTYDKNSNKSKQILEVECVQFIEYVLQSLKSKICLFFVIFIAPCFFLEIFYRKLYISLNFVVVMQNYITEAENEYVIRGNTAIMKCKIPSFVADFVFVDAWLTDNDITYTLFNTNNNRKSSYFGYIL